jgi:hypothetical protein
MQASIQPTSSRISSQRGYKADSELARSVLSLPFLVARLTLTNNYLTVIFTDSSCKSGHSIRGPWSDMLESRDWVVCPVTVPQEYDPTREYPAAVDEQQAVGSSSDTVPPESSTSQRLPAAAIGMQNASEAMQGASGAMKDALGPMQASGQDSPPLESRSTKRSRSLKNNLCRPTDDEASGSRRDGPAAAATAATAAAAARPQEPAPNVDWWHDQNATQLSIQYGETLDRSLARCDSLYALHKLIEFSVTS